MMSRQFRQAMDGLYLLCVIVAGTSLVLISAVIPWAVYTRYVLNRAASWPEPMAVLLTIVLTFFGAASCYRRGLHMNVGFFGGVLLRRFFVERPAIGRPPEPPTSVEHPAAAAFE